MIETFYVLNTVGAHAVTIGGGLSLEQFQVDPYGKFRIEKEYSSDRKVAMKVEFDKHELPISSTKISGGVAHDV